MGDPEQREMIFQDGKALKMIEKQIGTMETVQDDVKQVEKPVNNISF